MKPFNLAAALAGAPVVTRNGRPVTQLTKFDVVAVKPIIGVVHGVPIAFHLDGRYFIANISNYDLFMAATKRTVYVNLYKDPDGGVYGYVSNTKEEADHNASSDRLTGGAAIPLTFEE